MFLTLIKHSFYRRIYVLKLYRSLLKSSSCSPDSALREFYLKLFKKEFKKF